jgi:hypothetical protein
MATGLLLTLLYVSFLKCIYIHVCLVIRSLTAGLSAVPVPVKLDFDIDNIMSGRNEF